MHKPLPILVLALCSSGLLLGDVLTYTITPDSGQFFYDFTLTNTGSTGGTIFDLFLALPMDISNIETTTIGTPVGWGDANGGFLFFGPDVSSSTSFIQWSADFSGLYDVGIGNSLSGFSFTSSIDVGQPILYALNGSTELTIAQEAVPEPGTILLLAPLIGAVGLRGLFKSARARTDRLSSFGNPNFNVLASPITYRHHITPGS